MRAYSLCEDTCQCGDVIDERTSTYVGPVQTVEIDGESVNVKSVLEVSYCVIGWTADVDRHRETDDLEDAVTFDIREEWHEFYVKTVEGDEWWAGEIIDNYKEDYSGTYPLVTGFDTPEEAYKAMIKMASEDESWKMQ